jgi:hypothetical protein
MGDPYNLRYIARHLAMLNVDRDRCDRQGRYSMARSRC